MRCKDGFFEKILEHRLYLFIIAHYNRVNLFWRNEVFIVRNFFQKLQNALYRFMYGRNGSDALNVALLVVYLALWLVGSLVAAILDSGIVHLVVNFAMTVLAVIIFWRMLSKNLNKRRAENAKFLAWWYPMKNRIAGAKARRADKAHKYFTCRSCKTICRVPVGKGKIVITCPKCGAQIHGRS